MQRELLQKMLGSALIGATLTLVIIYLGQMTGLMPV